MDKCVFTSGITASMMSFCGWFGVSKCLSGWLSATHVNNRCGHGTVAWIETHTAAHWTVQGMQTHTHSLGGRGSSTRWYRWMSWRTEGSERTGCPLTWAPEHRKHTAHRGNFVLTRDENVMGCNVQQKLWWPTFGDLYKRYYLPLLLFLW